MERFNLRPEAVAGPARKEMRVSDLVSLVWGQRLAIAIACVSCVALAFVYLAAATPLYTATATLLIDSRKNPVARETESASGPLDIAEVESQMAIISSERVATAVLTRLKESGQAKQDGEPSLLKVLKSAVTSALRSVKAFLFGGPALQLTPEQQEVVNLLSGLSVRRAGAAYVINVSYTSPDPEQAAATANAFADAYIQEQLQSKAEAWKRAGVWLRDRLADLREQSRQSAVEAENYKAENGLNATRQGLLNEQQLEDLSKALLDARTKTAEAQSKLQQIRQVLSSDLSDISVSDALNNSVIVKLRQLYTEKFTAEAELSARFGKDHGAAVRLRQDMQNIQRAIRDELSRIKDSYESDYAVAQSNEKRLTNDYNALLATSSTANLARVNARELDRVAAGYENAYNQLLKQYNDSVNQQSFPLTEARVLSPAIMPLAASFPKKTLTVLLAAIIGGGLGMAFVILRRLLDGSIRSPDQVQALGLKCIALVPGLRYEQPRPPEVSLLDQLLKPELADMIPDHVKARFVLEAPLSRFTEQFRVIKSELAIAELHEPVTCLGFASGASGEGKSTLASNLAFLYAASGVRTLLIDGDLRNPSLSRILAPEAKVGLSDVLANFECLPEALQRDPSGLMFLPANVAQINDPGDLLGSPAMERLLKAARKNFDRVIIDLPPVGPVSGARTASRLLDSLIIVAEWRSTHAEALTATVEAFGHDRRKLLGCVINAVDFKSLGQHATYYYGAPSFPADAGITARGTGAV